MTERWFYWLALDVLLLVAGWALFIPAVTAAFRLDFFESAAWFGAGMVVTRVQRPIHRLAEPPAPSV